MAQLGPMTTFHSVKKRLLCEPGKKGTSSLRVKLILYVIILVVEETDYSNSVDDSFDGWEDTLEGGKLCFSIAHLSIIVKLVLTKHYIAQDDNFDRLVSSCLMFSFLKCIVVQHKVVVRDLRKGVLPNFSEVREGHWK